jgi:hypothetical protein
MSAPAALAAAKLMLPETEVSKTKYAKDFNIGKGSEYPVLLFDVMRNLQ